jgi:5-methylcytosine-specific restriction endonuclease McrA
MMARKIYPNHPKCVNYGCESFVILQGLDKEGNPRYRPHCGTCQKASWGGGNYRAGVTPFKTGECSNKDGHLGFKCLIKWSLVPNWATGMTEIDHINGDHANNAPSNLQELCPICHKLKGQMEGDYKGFRYKR